MPVEINRTMYYRTLETCRKTHIGRSTLFRWLKHGIIEVSCRDRRGWKLFTEEDLDRIKVEAMRLHTNKRQAED